MLLTRAFAVRSFAVSIELWREMRASLRVPQQPSDHSGRYFILFIELELTSRGTLSDGRSFCIASNIF